MIVFEEKADLVAWRTQWAETKPKLKIGLVPTMGALHAGHASLIEQMKAQCDVVVLSIFVNPLQFNPNEDLGQYPRTPAEDFKLAQEMGTDIVFHPQAHDIYSPNHSFRLTEHLVSQKLCGAFRKGHFEGVATIVLKLFHLVQPHLAIFGLKDAQQFFLISKLIQDLDLNIQIIGAPTIREADGLALSSRNRYLNPEERRKAPLLYQTLCNAHEKLLSSRDPASSILGTEKNMLNSNGFQVQYLELLEAPELQRQVDYLEKNKNYLLAIAAFLGKTRLIDNILIKIA